VSFRSIDSLREWIKTHQRLVVLTFFCVVLILGLVIYRDYGMFIDDPNQKALGEYVYNFIFLGNKTYLLHPDKGHGAIFELLLALILKAFDITADQPTYLFRHLATFITFYIGLIFFYSLMKKLTGNWKTGLLGSLLLLLSPRIFENAFYNSKDIPLMVVAIIAAYALLNFVEKPSFKSLVFLSLVSGFLVALRIVGLYIVVVTLVLMLVQFLIDRQYRWLILFFTGFLVITYAFIVLFWPYLWPDPIGNFFTAFTRMANYPYQEEVLYMGQYISPQSLPWHYIPVWIAVTTPLLYTFYFLIGLIQTPVEILKVKGPGLRVRGLFYMLLLGWFFVPLIAVIVFHSTLYNSWRHMFFIYPAFLAIALVGLNFLNYSVRTHFSNRLVRLLIPVTLIASLVGTTASMVKNHPYESMYYTLLAGRNMRSAHFRYEMDYSATCYREALEKILTEDDNSTIPIIVTHLTGKRNAYLLPLEERERLRYVTLASEAKYFIGDYHNRREEYNLGEGVNPWYRVSIDGVDLCVVYRLKDD
jgi:hypothetical protein